MTQKSIIIIGGGIAGLSTGCYAQMNGYKTMIFEKHQIPGGLCTSWNRKNYIIDGCIHWLVGAGKTSYFYKLWKELKAFTDDKIIFHEEFLRIKDKDGKELIVYTNADEFKKHLLLISPEDKKQINELNRVIKIFAKNELPISKSIDQYNIFEKIILFIRHFPIIMNLMKYKNISIEKFAEGFKNSFLKRLFPIIFDLPNFSMAILFFHLGWMHKKSSGYPICGSLNFSKNIEKRYKSLGGAITYNTNIKKIITEKNRVIGILTEDNKAHYADVVISSADIQTTLNDMLDNQYIDDNMKENIKQLEVFPPLIQVAFGISQDFKTKPHVTFYNLKNPINMAGMHYSFLKVEHSSYDSTLAPDGKSVVKVLFYSNFEFWEKLDKISYEQEKKQIISKVTSQLNEIYPGFIEQIEMVDVSTPLTYKRYTANHKGTWEGWLIDTKSIDMKLNKSLPNLANFFMVGHWVEIGGGVPNVALSARNLIQKICRLDKKKFVASS